VIIFALVILLILPFVYLFVTAPVGYQWTGLHTMTPGDFNNYFAYFEQIKDGHYLFIDHYTSEEQLRNIFKPEWLAIGLVGKLFNLDNRLLMQLARSILIIPFLWILYLFISYFFKSLKKRIASFIFLVFASGLGLVPLLLFQTDNSMDLWVPEINVFLTSLNSPHLIYSFSLLLLVFLFVFLGWEKNKGSYFIYAGLLANLSFISHPFNLPTIFGVTGAIVLYKIVKNRKIFISFFYNWILFCLVTLPSLGYLVYLFMFDVPTQIKAVQNECLTTPLWQTIFSYGFILVFAILGVVFIFKYKKVIPEKIKYLIIWAALQFALIYSPVVWQRRMTEGLSIPLGLLAIIGIFYLARLIKKKKFKVFETLNNKFLIIAVFIIIFCLSNIVVYSNDFKIHQTQRSENYVYAPDYIYDSFDWFDKNLKENDIILADPFVSNYIPGRTGNIVYAGHGVETLYFQAKKYQIVWFFKEETALEEKIEFLSKNFIDYIFFSDYPIVLGEDFSVPEFLNNKKYFKPVFEKQGIIIYEVVSHVILID